MRSTLRSLVIDLLALSAALIVTPLLRLRALFGRRQQPSPATVTPMSLNDPQWGKRGGSGGPGGPGGSGGGPGGGNEGPPDLDEVIKKFKQQLASLFGQKPSGNQNGGGSNGGEGGGKSAGPSNAAMGGGVALGLGGDTHG